MVTVFPKVSKKVHKKLYKQLKIIHSLGINYWVNGGTLLGLVRHGKIIPHDDDADVGIHESECEEIFNLLLEYCKTHPKYSVWRTIHGLKFFRDGNIGTDLFTYKIINDKYVLASEQSRNCWKNDYFLPEELNEIEIQSFGKIKVKTIKNPKRYLYTLYGNDCLTHAKLYYDHLNNKPISSEKIPIDKIKWE